MFYVKSAMCNVPQARPCRLRLGRDQLPGSRSTTSPIGFTLTELMVAVAIMALLILAINQVFSNVSQAVRSGIGASEIIQNSRIIGQQLEDDFGTASTKTMVGPSEGGILVIVNKAENSVHVLRSDDVNENGVVDIVTENDSSVRDDQITFIRKVSGAAQIEPLCPASTSTYAATSTASFAKVWYGHALRTLSDGSVPTSNNGDTLRGSLTGSGPQQPANHFAGDWIMARQVVFLDTATTNTVYAANARYNAGIGGGALGYSPAALYAGITDVAKSGLTTAGEDASNGAITGDAYDSAKPDAAARLWKTGTYAGASDYADRAYAYLYVPTTHRLLVNPKPDTATFEPWQIAQMTPYLAGHVSSIVVEFAGDYINTGGANLPGGSDPSSQTAGPDGTLDRWDNGSIIWYGLILHPPTGSASTADVFVNKSTTTAQQNPIIEQVSGQEIRYVFRHDIGATAGAGTNWPYLIRIRYRLIDSKGQVSGADGEPGRWFEQIMTVNRN